MCADRSESVFAKLSRRQFVRSVAAGSAALAMPGLIGRALADDTLRIGWVRPLTGPLASSFAALTAAGDIALEEINSAGGVLGRQLVKVEFDDAAAPANQPAVMREIISQGIKFVVGPQGSSQTLASLAISTDAKIIQSGFISAVEGGDGVKYPYHYQCTATVAAQAVQYARHIAQKTDFKKVGVLVEDSAAGTSVMDALRVELPAVGLTIAAEQVSPMRTTDMTPQLRALRAAGAEALCAFTANNIDTAQLFLGLQRLNWQPLLIGHFSLLAAAFDENVPESAKYPEVYAATYKALTFTDTERPSERLTSVVDKILAMNFPKLLIPSAAMSPFYDFLYLLKHSVEETSSFETDDIKAFLDGLDSYDGLFGKMAFTEQQHTGYGADSMALGKVFPDPHPLIDASQGQFRPRA